MLQIVIIMLKCGSCVVRWVDIDTLHLSGRFLFQCFEGEEVISVNQHIFGVRISIILGWIMKKNAWFYCGFFSFSYPCKF